MVVSYGCHVAQTVEEHSTQTFYTMSQKRPALSLLVTLTHVNRFSQFLANVYYQKFAISNAVAFGKFTTKSGLNDVCFG